MNNSYSFLFRFVYYTYLFYLGGVYIPVITHFIHIATSIFIATLAVITIIITSTTRKGCILPYSQLGF